MSQLSVIIPALNEAAHLPGLLDALNAQARPPLEIIVADAGSTDGTADLARARGAAVVPGGMPGPGRNAGAQVAKGDVFLFLDADVLPRPNFIELGLDEFERDGYAAATCPTEALSDDLLDKIIMEAANLYQQIILPVSPRAPGFCIFSRREIHQAIHGFDESLKMSEDHDYVRRASQLGKFGILTSTSIPVSMRRLEKEGIIGLSFKYLWCEMYALAGKPVRSIPFKYEFGAFQPAAAAKERPLIDVAELRALLGRFENPVQRASRAGLDELRRLVEMDPRELASKHIRLALSSSPDLDTLDRYLRQRLALIKEYKFISDGWSKLKSLPAESIQLLEASWMRTPQEGDEPLAQETEPKQEQDD